MSVVITLTTDFGLSDAYVAVMKGVILSINPEATLVDICHTIKPQNISQAAFVLSTAYPYFPQGTIHVVVVDPGVGTERRAVALQSPSAYFVAPDNGVLSYVLEQPSARPKPKATRRPRLTDLPKQKKLGPGMQAVVLTRPQFWRSPVSTTFHGRDIFAPVGAWLSRGVPLRELGEPVPSLAVLPLTCPHREPDGSLAGHVLHIDSFGNLITSIKGDDLPETRNGISIEVRKRVINGLSRTYGEAEALLALIGSSGHLEVSLKGGSAAGFLGAEVGDEVRIRQ